jgi:hypothetical protein
MANKKARILVNQTLDGIDYKVNQVIDADSALIKDLVKQGSVDDNAAAVKHCIDNEGAEPILHQTSEEVVAQNERKEAINNLSGEIAKLRADWAAASDADKPAIETAAAAKEAELAKL